MSRADPLLQAELLRRGRAGDSFRAIAAALGIGTMTVHRQWWRHSTAADRRARQQSQAGFGRWRRREDVERFLGQARSGLAWRAIGDEFFVDIKPENRAAAAWNTFWRFADDADKASRRAALKARNLNRPIGRGATAARRRIRLGLDNLFRGACFA